MGTAAAAKKCRKQQPKDSIRKTKTKDNKKKSSNNKIRSNVKKNKSETAAATAGEERTTNIVQRASASQQLSFFLNQYQSANCVQLSSLELDCLKAERCIAELQSPGKSITGNLAEHMKIVFGSSWKKALFEKHRQEGEVDPGNPSFLVICSSAVRSLEILRELRPLTKECHAAKLFSKHMKIEEQVSVLKNCVNIASGTPSRVKKLIDVEALGLSRLAVIVLDIHTDVKGYSLFTLPQVRDEFWDLYKSYFHQLLLEGKLRLCLYGPVPTTLQVKKTEPNDKVLIDVCRRS